ncbi:MAG: ABC transporter ATP-binding protein [Paludibacteraceae bacterium]|nr:ABC transporter ATP-binding protein [Paludibacteraceae bacterium]
MTAIEFNHVGKQYRLGLVGTGTLSHDLNRWWQTSILHHEDPYLKIGDVNDRAAKATSDYIWALRDIDFKVEQGDVVGIIGKNGAGKSTLLKLLSRVTAPTVGTINARGRIASLLEVGTGFHSEMTGRENIYMNGAILGMTKQEISAKLDEIIAFSGCEKYIDTPVKRYSSGMTVRLGFAVAAFLEPEILVVDEVLAVGDAEFQKKAIGKMQDVASGGRTVLFVSHNMASLRRLCHRGVLLENGSVINDGPINEVVDFYLQDSLKGLGVQWSKPIVDKNFQCYQAELLPESGDPKDVFSCDEDIILRLHVRTKEVIPGLYGYVSIAKGDGMVAWEFDSNDKQMNRLADLPLGDSVIDITIPKRTLAPGQYSIYLNFNSHQNFSGVDVDTAGDICKFAITDEFTQRGNNRNGMFSTLVDWNIH